MLGLSCRERVEEFVESEAELSGSDVSSDEEDRPGSEVDLYEEEGGGSDVPHSDSELHQQVNKIHMWVPLHPQLYGQWLSPLLSTQEATVGG